MAAIFTKKNTYFMYEQNECSVWTEQYKTLTNDIQETYYSETN